MIPNRVDTTDGMVGYLTWVEYDRLERAVTNALKHLSWWRVCGHMRTGDPDEHRFNKQRRRGAQPLPLPAAWLAAEEIARLLRELNEWHELADAARDIDGADFARLLTREVETAMAHWPISDRPHRVRYYRCPACDQMTLNYYPPNAKPRDDDRQTITRIVDGRRTTVEIRPATVRCSDRENCGAVMGEAQWAIAARIAAHEHQERTSGKKK